MTGRLEKALWNRTTCQLQIRKLLHTKCAVLVRRLLFPAQGSLLFLPATLRTRHTRFYTIRARGINLLVWDGPKTCRADMERACVFEGAGLKAKEMSASVNWMDEVRTDPFFLTQGTCTNWSTCAKALHSTMRQERGRLMCRRRRVWMRHVECAVSTSLGPPVAALSHWDVWV